MSNERIYLVFRSKPKDLICFPEAVFVDAGYERGSEKSDPNNLYFKIRSDKTPRQILEGLDKVIEITTRKRADVSDFLRGTEQDNKNAWKNDERFIGYLKNIDYDLLANIFMRYLSVLDGAWSFV
ncbi:MAG: hypothetical protein ABIH37_00920 [archaeon]